MGDGVESISSSKPLDGMAAASPIVFSDTLGLFQRAAGPCLDTVVVFASPWGLEELCTTRKFWRIIADRLASRGIASLRFDWPGTGDGRDDIDFSSEKRFERDL